jgi:predicted nucleic acid-binding Zn finger protein
MEKPSEPGVLKEICREIQVEKRVTDAHLARLSLAFGSRFDRAWEALREGRIKKYVFKPSGRTVWIVVGKRRDYIVMPDAEFCSCEDFYFKFDKGHLCYHIIAQKLAEATDRFDLIEDDDSFYDVLIKEWKAVETRVSKRRREKAPLNSLSSK